MRELLKKNKDLQELLFIRGFLATDRKGLDLNEFPFYGNWECRELGGIYFLFHKLTGFRYFEKDGTVWFIYGHAYNPFTMETDEEKILERIAEHSNEDTVFDLIDELTGIFVLGVLKDGKISYMTDPSGMQSAYYGVDRGCFYLTSHFQLVGDLCGYEMDPFVRKLLSYKWYPRVMGPYLPGDLTAFRQLKRVVPNIYYTFDSKSEQIQHKRFYPLKEIKTCKTEEEYEGVIRAAGDILHSNMELVLKKWDKTAQSLTGGIDSNTTFAAANGFYGQYRTFSYCSAEKETIDCEAAKKIAAHFDVPWTLYQVPDADGEIDRFDVKKRIIDHNDGYVMLTKPNELRKRMFLQEHCDFDVEIKSWTSETIRAYWYKHYNRKRMPKLSAKLFRNLYKIFLLNRPLAHKVDRVFAEYIRKFGYADIPASYPPADLHYNEVTWGSWGGSNISEMKYCFDITIIYNNRKFLDLLFRIPLSDRISDKHHLALKKYLNPELFDMNIRVVNMKETKFRANALNAIFTVNSILPF